MEHRLKPPGNGLQPSPKSPLAPASLILSVLVHALVFFIVGGAVVYEGLIKSSPIFQAAEVSGSQDPDMEVIPEPDQEESIEAPKAPTLEQSPGSPSADLPMQTADTPADLLVTSLPSTINIPAAVTVTARAPLQAGNNAGGGSGTGNGSGGGGKGPVRNVTMQQLFGSDGSDHGAGLKGIFIDGKRDAKGNPRNRASLFMETYENSGAKGLLRDFWSSKKELVGTQIFVPIVDAIEMPKAFGLEKEVQPNRVFVIYSGTVVSPISGTIRFLGYADDHLQVRLGDQPVFKFQWPNRDARPGDPLHRIGSGTCGFGDWFEVTKGQSYPIEILIGEGGGGKFAAFLLYEIKNKKYDPPVKNAWPKYDLFRTANLTLELPPPNPAYADYPNYEKNSPVWEVVSP